jgi:hypothetical protein
MGELRQDMVRALVELALSSAREQSACVPTAKANALRNGSALLYQGNLDPAMRLTFIS